MSRGAKVQTLEAVRSVRAALVRFAEDVGATIATIEGEAGRTGQWLSLDRPSYWKREVRAREEEVERCKAEIQRKILIAAPEPASVVEERRGVARAQARLEESRRRQEASRQWGSRWDRESLMALATLQPLKQGVGADVPRAIARLDAMLEHLEAYARLEVPEGAATLGSGLDGDPGEGAASMSRGGPERGIEVDWRGLGSGLAARAEEVRREARAPRGELTLVGWKCGAVRGEDAEALATLGGGSERARGTLALSWRALGEEKVALVRLEPRDAGDSGWVVLGTEPGALLGACWRIGVDAMRAHDPGLDGAWGLGVGAVVLLDAGRVRAVLDGSFRDVWNAE